MNVPETIRAAFENEGLTVTAAAKRLLISRPAFSNVVNGNADLSVDLALRLESEFGLDARAMLIAQLDVAIAAARAAS